MATNRTGQDRSRLLQINRAATGRESELACNLVEAKASNFWQRVPPGTKANRPKEFQWRSATKRTRSIGMANGSGGDFGPGSALRPHGRPRSNKKNCQVGGTRVKLTSILGRTMIVLISVALSSLNASSYGPFTLQDFQTRAAFELVVNDAKPLTAGTSKITTQSAYVTLAHGLLPGNSDGLEIQFFPQPIIEKVKADILENDAKELKKTSYAAFVLYVGKDNNKIWQANLSFVVPGTTVARTVAWKPEELRKYFRDYSFDGKRLVLKSKGSYSESDKGGEQLRLSWDVDLNLPVIREVKR